MITEKEHCKIIDLAIIRSAISVLRNIVPECGHNHIPKNEWQEVMQQMIKWEQRLIVNSDIE